LRWQDYRLQLLMNERPEGKRHWPRESCWLVAISFISTYCKNYSIPVVNYKGFGNNTA
jgi:hypothetical protein